MEMIEIIPKDSLEITKEKTRTELWENHKGIAQSIGRGFSKEKNQGQVSRKRTWNKCYLGSQGVNPKTERGTKIFTVSEWLTRIIPLELKIKMSWDISAREEQRG